MRQMMTVALWVGGLAACGGGATEPLVDVCALGPPIAQAVAPAASAPVPGSLFRPALVAPSGVRALGTVALHLVDAQRDDPWSPTAARRELMVTLWYPATGTAGRPRTAYQTEAEFALSQRADGVPPGLLAAPLTHGFELAPVDQAHGALPVILYSPGGAASRAMNTMVIEELASRGYLVASIDHTFDAVAVEFPGGRVLTRSLPETPPNLAAVIDVRAQDARFVLDALGLLQLGVNPDAEGRALPTGLHGALDLERIGIFGSSLGGSTAMAVLLADARVKAGLSLDSQPYGPVIQAGLDKPFMMINAKARRELLPSLAGFWSRLRGWRLELRMSGAGHVSYSDYVYTLPQSAAVLGLSPEEAGEMVGQVDPLRAVTVQRAYPLAFFDRQLRGGRCNALLDGPSAALPEVVFVP